MQQKGSRTYLQEQEPKGWRELSEQAQRERNPEKLDAIIKRMNLLLTEHERKSRGAEDGRGNDRTLQTDLGELNYSDQ